MPHAPQKEAGRVIEPPVCDAVAPKHMPQAMAAAEPLLLPPGVRSRFQGLRVGGGSKLAYAVVTVLPTKTAPACRRRSTTGQSLRAMLLAHNFDPAAVGQSKTSKMSLTPIGMPCSGPRYRPRSSSFVISSACARPS